MSRKRILISGIVIIAVAAAAVVLFHRKPVPVAKIIKPVATTQAVKPPATRHARVPVPTYMQLIRAENPAVATTQPLAFALDLHDAARLIVHDPVYLDQTGNLWFTRADGEPTEKALQEPADLTEHVIRDGPVFVHWWVTDTGNWAADVVVHHGNGYDIISKDARKHLAGDRPYRWASAFSVMGKMVVSTDAGVSVFEIQPNVVEHYHALPGCAKGTNPPVATADTRGILAWAPWEHHRPGSRGISRFVDGKWSDLPLDQWPARPIQLSILLDGSVLRISADAPAIAAKTPAAPTDDDDVITTNVDPDAALKALPDHVEITIGQLEPLQFDLEHVNDLITRLDDPDIDVREAAFEELSRYGPSLSPLLEKVVDQQRPEGQMRIRQLLRNKLTPALGGMMPIDGRLMVARRYPNGTVLFFAPAGVQIPTEHEDPDVVNPAWIVQRPDGRMDRPLPPELVADQNPDAPTLVPVKDEWLVCDAAGPRRFFGNKLVPMLSPAETRFSKLVGISQMRQWIFTEATNPRSATQPAPADAIASHRDTLIIDPYIPDPTPRLPVWTIAMSKGTAGWDAKNFPAIVGEGDGANWELGTNGWKRLETTDKVHTTVEPPPPLSSPTTVPTTTPTTPATLPSTGPTTAVSLGKPILVAVDGTHYYGGRDALIIVKPNGGQTRWTLPGAAVGTADPILIQTGDQHLFLYNQAGRLLRIKPTPGEAEPFKLEATFTHDIPSGDNPIRIWLDPAGRIDWIADGKSLSVMFPAGHIPPAISNMMLSDQP